MRTSVFYPLLFIPVGIYAQSNNTDFPTSGIRVSYSDDVTLPVTTSVFDKKLPDMVYLSNPLYKKSAGETTGDKIATSWPSNGDYRCISVSDSLIVIANKNNRHDEFVPVYKDGTPIPQTAKLPLKIDLKPWINTAEPLFKYVDNHYVDSVSQLSLIPFLGVNVLCDENGKIEECIFMFRPQSVFTKLTPDNFAEIEKIIKEKAKFSVTKEGKKWAAIRANCWFGPIGNWIRPDEVGARNREKRVVLGSPNGSPNTVRRVIYLK